MKPSEYKKLEEDRDFKHYYLKKTTWWKSFLLLAPALLMFVGLAGIMHMAYNDRIWTLYCLPYIIVFALGTIWLKGIKKYIQNSLLNRANSYLLCAARSLGDYNGYHYIIYSKENKRHNEFLINKLIDELSIDSFSKEELKEAIEKPIDITTSETETQIYMKAFAVSNILKTNRENITTGITPLLYISDKYVFVVRNKDLK